MPRFMRPYARSLRERYRGFVPIQAVGQPIEPGDLIVKVFPRAISRRGNIRDYGIISKTLQPAGNHDVGISSDEKLLFSAKLKGKPPIEWSQFGIDDVGLSIKMTSKRAFYFKASGAEFIRLENPQSVYNQIKDKFIAGDWPPRLMVIDSVIKTKRYVLGVSSSNEGIFEIGINTDDPDAKPTATNLLDLDFDISLQRSSQVQIDTVSNVPNVFAFMPTRLSLRTHGTQAAMAETLAGGTSDVDDLPTNVIKRFQASIDFDVVDSVEFADILDYDEELTQ